MNETVYYLLFDCLVGKKDNGRYYLFRDGQWYPDNGYVIMDRLMGYDSSEPDDSPYAMGNGSVMGEIEEISFSKAMEMTGGEK